MIHNYNYDYQLGKLVLVLVLVLVLLAISKGVRVSTGRSFLNLYHSKDFLDITSLDVSSRGPMNLQ